MQKNALKTPTNMGVVRVCLCVRCKSAGVRAVSGAGSDGSWKLIGSPWVVFRSGLVAGLQKHHLLTSSCWS